MKRYTHLAGVRLWYDRRDHGDYGHGTPAGFDLEPAFAERLVAMFAELWDLHPKGRATAILSAGGYVPKSGLHGQGRAFDVDGFRWADGSVTMARDYPRWAREYLGVEAVFRKHLGTVLGWHYDAAHRDHWHLDNGSAPLWSAASRSRVGFVQAVLAVIARQPVAVSGRWDEATAQALRATAGDLADFHRSWHKWLDQVATSCFDRPAVVAEPVGPSNPLDGFWRLYQVIAAELGSTALRKPVEAALNDLALLPETQDWLAQWRPAG